MARIDLLKEHFAISESDFNWIQARIIELMCSRLRPSNRPVVVILGAQPGAGKTELEKLAQLDYGSNIIACNADIFRDYHPDVENIKKDYEDYYPELTAQYAQAWNNGLRKHCEDNRFNYILETTFSSGDLMNATIRALKDKGYFVDLRLLAVHPKFSILGTHLRYERMKAVEKHGRLVSLSAHNDRFSKIPETLLSVEAAHLYDELRLYRRIIPPERLAPDTSLDLFALNPPDPYNIYKNEVQKNWSNDMNVFCHDVQLQVIRAKEIRKAPKSEIKLFKQLMARPFLFEWPSVERENEIRNQFKSDQGISKGRKL